MSDPAIRLRGSAYSDDTGEPDSALARALTAYAAGDGTYVAALAALCAARVLVPVVAVLGEVEHDEAGLAHDKSSDMATVLLTGADGRLALLAFTGAAPMTDWNPEARPVAVPAAVAAQSAVQEGAAALVVDLAGPVTLVVEGDDLVRLASGAVLGRAGEHWAWIGTPGESSDSIQR